MFTRFVSKRANSDSLSSKRSRTESTAGSIKFISEGKSVSDLSIHNKTTTLRNEPLNNSLIIPQINPSYIEPKLPFTLKAIVNKKSDEASDLKLRLNILSTKFKTKEVEKSIELSEKQDIIEEKEKKIEDLEKSLVFLVSSEKEALDNIKKLEADILKIQELTEQKDQEEKELREELHILREKIILLENDKNSITTELQEKSIIYETDLETFQQENILLKEHLSNLEEKASLKSPTLISKEINLEQLSAENNQNSALFLSQQLNLSQDSLTQLQIQFQQLSSQVSKYKKSREKYSIALEEKRSLEAIVDSLKLEITNLNKTLSGFDAQTHSWSNFFASQNEFKSIDDLWIKLNEDQKVLKDKENDVDILTSKLQQREKSISSLTEENTALKASLESIQNQLQQGQLTIKKAEKVASLNQKEIQLLKNQLAIYSSMEEKVEEESIEETQESEPSS